MQHLILFSILFSLVPFSFSLLLDLCLGHPGAEQNFDRKAIFFGWSYFLAKRRLKKVGQYKEIEDTYEPNLNSEDPFVKHTARMQKKQVVFQNGREFFSWELGLGMCPFCTNVRVSIIAALILILFFAGNIVLVLLVPCFSNMFLLLFNKNKN